VFNVVAAEPCSIGLSMKPFRAICRRTLFNWPLPRATDTRDALADGFAAQVAETLDTDVHLTQARSMVVPGAL
jgi:hypothetical protein